MRRRSVVLGLGLVGLALVAPACAGTTRPAGLTTAPPEPTKRIVGLASWYGQRHQGRPTASGEMYDMNKLTAAHRTMPFGTRLRVTNTENGRFVVVRVTDRGPFASGRILDVSLAAAKALGMVGDGVAHVEIAVLANSE